MSDKSVSVKLSYKGQHVMMSNVTPETTVEDLQSYVEKEFGLEKDCMKLLHKGKKLENKKTNIIAISSSSKIVKVMVMATPKTQVEQVLNRKSDPTIRGFDQEQSRDQRKGGTVWQTDQDRQFKFCRFQECSWQSFGHRTSNDATPHSFRARALLEQLATDPGIVAIMKDRELVVNTLGEMDPIDDRIMEKQESQNGGCLLGYNTNRGLRIDLKLRSNDLQTFRPYPELVSTLIHELSHNWVSDHNLLFWTNYGQMRADYFCNHLYSTKLVNGKTTSQIAQLPQSLIQAHNHKKQDAVFMYIMNELRKEMMQHGLSPELISSAIQSRCYELQNQYQTNAGHSLDNQNSMYQQRDQRELILEAVSKRQQNSKKHDSNHTDTKKS